MKSFKTDVFNGIARIIPVFLKKDRMKAIRTGGLERFKGMNSNVNFSRGNRSR